MLIVNFHAKMQCKFIYTCVAFPKELHTHNSKNEDDNTEDKGKVTKSTNSFPHDGDEKIQSWPWLGKFEHSKLEILSK